MSSAVGELWCPLADGASSIGAATRLEGRRSRAGRSRRTMLKTVAQRTVPLIGTVLLMWPMPEAGAQAPPLGSSITSIEADSGGTGQDMQTLGNKTPTTTNGGSSCGVVLFWTKNRW